MSLVASKSINWLVSIYVLFVIEFRDTHRAGDEGVRDMIAAPMAILTPMGFGKNLAEFSTLCIYGRVV